jgi:hypothetical protein
MPRSWNLWIATIIVALSLGVQPLPAAPDQAGYVLVDKLVLLFNQMASSTTLNPDQVSKSLAEIMNLARTAKAEHRIDDQFFERYSRVLRMFKLVTTKDEGDILKPMAQQEYAAFIRDVTGKKVESQPTIGELAQAITHELESLKKSLDQKR